MARWPIQSKKQGRKMRSRGRSWRRWVGGGKVKGWTKFEKEGIGNIRRSLQNRGLGTLCQLWLGLYRGDRHQNATYLAETRSLLCFLFCSFCCLLYRDRKRIIPHDIFSESSRFFILILTCNLSSTFFSRTTWVITFSIHWLGTLTC